jgi:hypothetical protein
VSGGTNNVKIRKCCRKSALNVVEYAHNLTPEVFREGNLQNMREILGTIAFSFIIIVIGNAVIVT